MHGGIFRLPASVFVVSGLIMAACNAKTVAARISYFCRAFADDLESESDAVERHHD